MLIYFLYRALVIDITNRRGLSNEVHHELLLKRSKYFPFILQQNLFNRLYLINKMERFGFESGHAVWVVKLIKGDWPIVLQ